MATSKKTTRKTPAPAVPEPGAVLAASAQNYPALLAEVKAWWSSFPPICA
jgi:hypothetical protein